MTRSCSLSHRFNLHGVRYIDLQGSIIWSYGHISYLGILACKPTGSFKSHCLSIFHARQIVLDVYTPSSGPPGRHDRFVLIGLLAV